jgi:hypothetical protein
MQQFSLQLHAVLAAAALRIASIPMATRGNTSLTNFARMVRAQQANA